MSYKYNIYVFSKSHQNAIYVAAYDTEMDAEKAENEILKAKDDGVERLTLMTPTNDGALVRTTIYLSEVFLIQTVKRAVGDSVTNTAAAI